MGNQEEHCVPKESVKAAELGECNKEENTWTEVKHHFEATQAARGALYSDELGICKPQTTKKRKFTQTLFSPFTQTLLLVLHFTSPDKV